MSDELSYRARGVKDSCHRVEQGPVRARTSSSTCPLGKIWPVSSGYSQKQPSQVRQLFSRGCNVPPDPLDLLVDFFIR